MIVAEFLESAEPMNLFRFPIVRKERGCAFRRLKKVHLTGVQQPNCGPHVESFSSPKHSPTTLAFQLSLGIAWEPYNTAPDPPAFPFPFPFSLNSIYFSLLSVVRKQLPRYPTMADPVAIQDEIALLEKKLAEVQEQLNDAKSRLEKAQQTSTGGDAGANLSHEEKMDLIKVNLQEVLNPEIMEEAIKRNGHLKVYWGTATTGRPHCGYVCSFDCKRRRSRVLTDTTIVRTHPQNRTIPLRRLPRQSPPRRHPRLPRQPESTHRARQVPRRILPLHHRRAAKGSQRPDRQARVRLRI